MFASDTRHTSYRRNILSEIEPDDYRWAVPIMRVGYAGRAVVYVTIAGLSLWSIALGGTAEGTHSVMQTLTQDAWWVLAFIAFGMFAYAIWRFIDCFGDLEAHGTDAKGVIARTGMLVTGAIHGALGIAALSALGLMSGGGGSGGDKQALVAKVFTLPGGVVLVGIAGILTICASIYYIEKGISENYRENLAGNEFTARWNWFLKTGVIAQGVVVAIIGGLILYAALQVDPSNVGGMNAAFEWLRGQPYGRVLVAVLCAGLFAFGVFCMVNAVYRIVPKASDGSRKTLADRLKSSGQSSTG